MPKTVMPKTAERPPCRHCHKKKSIRGKRGLCWTCFNSPALALYPPKKPGTQNVIWEYIPEEDSANMNEAELDALIARQLPTMPKEGVGSGRE